MPNLPAKVTDQRNAIVQSFIDNLDTRGLEFVQEWAAGASPFNPITGNRYRGVNRTNLRALASMRGSKDPRWLTWKQIQLAGYRVRKGARSAAIEKWKPYTYERTVDGSDQPQTRRGVACVGWYNVFNGQDIIGLPAYEPPATELPESAVTDIADRLIETSRCPVVEDEDARAYYNLEHDYIHIPARGLFIGSDDMRAQHFVRTLAHEMIHSTMVKMQRDPADYAFEELVAELGAVLLTSNLGLVIMLDQSDPNWMQHAAYIQSWAQGLRDRPQTLWAASAQADKATAYLMDNYNGTGEGDSDATSA